MSEPNRSEEMFGKGSIVDLIVAPFWAIGALLGIVQAAPRLTGRRDAFLVLAFWATVALVAGASWWCFA